METLLVAVGMEGSRRLVAAYVIGTCDYVAGLALSAVLDLPSGAMIAWTLAGCGVAATLLMAVRNRKNPTAIAHV